MMQLTAKRLNLEVFNTSRMMIDLGCETDGNNEICLCVRFALCSTIRSYIEHFS